jgi:hypothetical protein
MQDWDIQLADPHRVEEFCQLYAKLIDEDEKFALMELIIASLEENLQAKGNDGKLVERVKSLLNSDFLLHQDTIEYWCEFKEDTPEHYWMVTPTMRLAWRENTR